MVEAKALVRRLDALKNRVERLIAPRPIGASMRLRVPRHLDPQDALPMFDEWAVLRDEVRKDPECLAVPVRATPRSSETTHYEGRGYIKYHHLARLLADIQYARDLIDHPGRIDSESGPSLHPRLRTAAYILGIFGPALGSLLALIAIGYHLFENQRFLEILLIDHPRATIGLPAAAASAYATVLSFQATSGPIRFKGLGLEFEGASGPVALFVFIFLAEVAAIVALWG
jgi:hypothetical protein